jgi:hypothetical protein
MLPHTGRELLDELVDLIHQAGTRYTAMGGIPLEGPRLVRDVHVSVAATACGWLRYLATRRVGVVGRSLLPLQLLTCWSALP